MQSHQFLDACQNLRAFRPFLGFCHRSPSPSSNSLFFLSKGSISKDSKVSCSSDVGKRKPRNGEKQRGKSGGGERVRIKEKENVWSIDNELAKTTEKSGRRRRGRRVKNVGRSRNSRVIISAAMLMEVETVLQTQEPVIIPAWSTFASSVSGIWKGVSAVFSPFTAEMEPIGVGIQNENLYDCYTLSHIEQVPPPSEDLSSQIKRKINWVALNPYGEIQQRTRGGDKNKEAGKDGDGPSSKSFNPIDTLRDLPSYGSFDFDLSEMLEEDFMNMEPGLIFFEDGSYSRGPVDIPVGELDESKYFLSPTFKFEQCLVKGCHKRLRIVHTIEFNEGGSDIQIIRVAVYEEQWVSPANLYDKNDLEFDLKPFSQRKRAQPSELTGSWKVFEVSATPIFGEQATTEGGRLQYVYLCTETLKKRSLPENPVYFGEEEMLDMQDVAVLWLPGGITGYVDVKKDGILCIGVGWYSDEGINLVMERDYGTDGKLKEARWKTEVKRRWSDQFPV
ncbi:uncharacterized protein LOC131248048 [Magnolia sinica]|uniref:uncharacterized protein LOC131248048 n=1 Tax=Magnolia sinica TaxID=86752 RepID=UPI0026586735|nr:uncharacterized protein LOC131248048 [Magnolia sinica]